MEKHNILGRRMIPAMFPLSRFFGYEPLAAVQYLTADGFNFNPLPLYKGGNVARLDYASHAIFKPNTKTRSRETTMNEVCVFSLSIDQASNSNDKEIVFTSSKDAANFLSKLKQEIITADEIETLADASEKQFPVIGVHQNTWVPLRKVA